MTEVLVAILGFAAVVLGIGLLAGKSSNRSADEYFLAGRTLGALILFMALFGTNCSPFVLVGIPGRAYHDGLALFTMNAPLIALIVPLSFYVVGVPARRMAARLGAMTPVELYARRLRSDLVAWTLFAAFCIYTVPYMVTGVDGLAKTLFAQTDGAIGERTAAIFILALALSYTWQGGMRATAWTNVVQGVFFLGFMIAAIVLLITHLGGPTAAIEQVRAKSPALLYLDPTRPTQSPTFLLTYGLVISLTVIAFPHMLVRLMAAKDDRAIKGAFRLYPPALLLLWIAAVGIGVFGAVIEPGLEGRASDRIFGVVTERALPAGFGTLGVIAVLAAVLSTLDAQILTLSSMLTRDALPRLQAGRGAAARESVLAGKLFGVLVAVAVLIAREAFPGSIFKVATFAFSGYVTLVPTLYLGLVWRRFTAAGAVASIVAGNALLLAVTGFGVPTGAVHPGFLALLVAAGAAVVVSLATKPPDPEALQEAFGPDLEPDLDRILDDRRGAPPHTSG